MAKVPIVIEMTVELTKITDKIETDEVVQLPSS